MKPLVRVVIVFLGLLCGTLSAQDIKVFADTDSSDYRIGDYINYKLEIRHGKDVEVIIPSIKDSVNNLTFIKENEPFKNELDKEIVEIRNYVFSNYDSAAVTIPSYKIQYKGKGATELYSAKVNPVDIVIHSFKVNPQKGIIDIKKPVTVPIDWVFVLIIILIIIIVVLLIVYGIIYYRKKKAAREPERVTITLTPQKIAMDSLIKLEEKELWQNGMVKEYHSEITGVIRKYFQGRYQFAAMEMPSSEVLDNLKYINESEGIFDVTRDFLNNADMVKFAKFQPMPEINMEMMTQAKEIVEKTKTIDIFSDDEEVKDV